MSRGIADVIVLDVCLLSVHNILYRMCHWHWQCVDTVCWRCLVHGTEEETENSANCLWLVTNSKPCPNCKSPIQKN